MKKSILDDCLKELRKMTDEEVVQKCKDLGLYNKYDNEKYKDDDFEIVLPNEDN